MHAPEAGPSSPDHATTTGERAVIARVSDGRNAITSLSAVLISTYTAFGQHRAHFARTVVGDEAQLFITATSS
jgi:hypothetical protein